MFPLPRIRYIVRAQWRELLAQLEMERRRLRLVDAELHYRNAGIGIDVPEYAPRAVIEAPRVVQPHRQRREHLLHATGEIRVAGRRILHLI